MKRRLALKNILAGVGTAFVVPSILARPPKVEPIAEQVTFEEEVVITKGDIPDAVCKVEILDNDRVVGTLYSHDANITIEHEPRQMIDGTSGQIHYEPRLKSWYAEGNFMSSDMREEDVYTVLTQMSMRMYYMSNDRVYTGSCYIENIMEESGKDDTLFIKFIGNQTLTT